MSRVTRRRRSRHLEGPSGLVPEAARPSGAQGVGYASEMGRHVKEGRVPEVKDALLMVGLAASLAAYLTEHTKD
jgi:hypothetical protein